MQWEDQLVRFVYVRHGAGGVKGGGQMTEAGAVCGIAFVRAVIRRSGRGQERQRQDQQAQEGRGYSDQKPLSCLPGNGFGKRGGVVQTHGREATTGMGSCPVGTDLKSSRYEYTLRLASATGARYAFPMKHSKHRMEILARGVCVVNGQLLLCHSRDATNTYLPGGHVEFREPARAALEREIAEELGLRAKAGKFLGCVEHVFRQKGEWHTEINLVFELRIPGLTPARHPSAQEEWIEFRWAPLARLRQAKLEPAVLIPHLPRWLRGAPGFAGTAGVWN